MRTIQWIMILALAMTTACTSKKREAKLAQGESMTGVFKLSDFDKKEYAIETLEPMGEENSKSSKDINYEVGSDGKAVFPVVRYKTEAPQELIKAINNDQWPLSARPNTKDKYSYLFQITDTQLVIYKKARKEDMSQSEINLATAFGEHLIVPQLSFEINLYKMEKIKNSNDEDTASIRLFPVTKVSEANYFKPNMTSANYLKMHSKEFILPKTYFEGEWFFSATVIQMKMDDQRGLPTGFDLTADLGMKAVSRIKMNVEQFRVVGVNQNYDAGVGEEESGTEPKDEGTTTTTTEATEEDEDLQKDDAITIPSEMIDFGMAPEVAGKKILEEQKFDKNHIERKSWEHRKYVSLNFFNVTSVASMIAKNRALSDDSTLIDLSVTQDYMGFTLLYNAKKIKIRYSFKRAHEPVAGKKAFESDMDQFYGFFTTEKNFIPGPQHVRRKDFDDNSFLNRFYPKVNPTTGVKEIVYHFSKTSPKEPGVYRQAARDAISDWNKAFKMAGTDFILRLDESFDVDVGDLRFNTINLIDEKMDTGLLGYGPSISDTKSGEIISATTNMYLTPFRNDLIRSLRDYVYYEIGKIKNERLYNSSDYLRNLSQNLFDSGLNNSFLNQLIKKQDEAQQKFQSISSLSSHQVSSAQGSVNSNRISSCSNYVITAADLIVRAQKECREDLSKYIDLLKSQNKTNISADESPENNEFAVLSRCAEKLAYTPLKHTMLHELGHNFGLRHNFAASLDAKNYTDEAMKKNFPETDTNPEVASASVMDYLSPSAVDMKRPGPYDIAAIRWGYTGKVELANTPNQYVQLDPNQKITDSPVFQQGIRRFQFCTDEDTSEDSFTRNALCFRHDYGSNPVEIVQNKINEMNAFFSIYRYKFDFMEAAAKDGEVLAGYASRRYMQPMLRIYAEWRSLFAETLKDKSRISLYSFTPETYEAEVKRLALQLPENRREQYLHYYAASQMIADFMLELATIAPKVCIGNDSQGNTMVLAFSDLIADLQISDEFAKDCSADNVQNLLKKKGMTEFVGEFGEIYKDLQFDSSTKKTRTFWINDILGIESIVESARSNIIKNLNYSIQHRQMDLNPTIIQDPSVREKLTTYIYNSVNRGVEASKYGIKANQKSQFIPIFKDTGDSVQSLFGTLKSGLKTNTEASSVKRWAKKVSIFRVYEEKDVKGAVALSRSDFDQGHYLFAHQDGPFAIETLDNFNRLNVFEMFAEETNGDLSEFKKTLNLILQKIGNKNLAELSFAEMNQIYAAISIELSRDSLVQKYVLDELMRPLLSSLDISGDSNLSALEILKQNRINLRYLQAENFAQAAELMIADYEFFLKNRSEKQVQLKNLKIFLNSDMANIN